MGNKKKDVRVKFREDVFTRDGNKCKVCGATDVKLDAHHITDRSLMPNGGYVKENGITLCDQLNGCHMKAEEYHLTEGNRCQKKYEPEQLYKLINSSYEKAVYQSEKL